MADFIFLQYFRATC